jgi:plastocyanin
MRILLSTIGIATFLLTGCANESPSTEEAQPRSSPAAVAEGLERRLSFEFQGVEAQVIARLVSEVSGRTVIVDPSLATRRIDVKLNNVPARMVIDAVAAQLSAGVREVGADLVMSPIPPEAPGSAVHGDLRPPSPTPASAPLPPAGELEALRARVTELEGQLAAERETRAQSASHLVGNPVVSPPSPVPASPPPARVESPPSTPRDTAPAPVVGLLMANPGATVRGIVRFAGPAPVVATFSKRSDPGCSTSTGRDESILVSNGKLANVVVRVSKGLPDFHATPAPPVQIVQRDCTYTPRVVAVMNGTTVEVTNGDRTLHNIHAYLGRKTLFSRAQPPGSNPVDYVPKDGGMVIALKCDVHHWMEAFVFVNQNPFVTVTNASGSFQLAGLPGGTYTIEAWHEKLGTQSAEVNVSPGGVAETEFTFGAE